MMLKEVEGIKARILSDLRYTMDNWACLDKDMVEETVDDFLENVTVEDEIFYYDGMMIRDYMMVVANIKRRINSQK